MSRSVKVGYEDLEDATEDNTGYAVFWDLTDEEVTYIENQWIGFVLDTNQRLQELREHKDSFILRRGEDVSSTETARVEQNRPST